MTQTITGVQRYAIEVTKNLDHLISKGTINNEQYKFIILVPKNSKYKLHLENIEIKAVGKLRGHLWEQIELPFFSSNGLLVNLCNTAPIFSGYQILTIHDASVSANKNNYSFLFKFWYQLLYRILPFRTQKIVTDSNFSKDELIKYYPIKEEKIKTIYLGTEHLKAVKSNNDILQKLNLGNTSYILAVSNMNPNKNFSGIITSLNYIKNQDIQVVIVGPKDNPIYNEVDIHSSLRVNLVGYVSDEELSVIYKNATCFVYPSFYEGFGLPPLEAMVNGCPVVVSNKASLPEVLGDAAIYCNPYDPKDIAEKIEQVLNDEKLRNELKIKGLERVNIYSWERCALEIFKVMMEVMDS